MTASLFKPKRPNRGKSFEALIAASARSGIVSLTKIEAGTQWVGGGRKIQVAAVCDFVGCVVGSGTSFVFDAKVASTVGRYDIGHPDHMSAKQRGWIVEQGRAGAIAGLLVESVARSRVYWVPWPVLVNLPPSVKWDDLRLVDVGRSGVAIDWRRIVGTGSRDPTPATKGAI